MNQSRWLRLMSTWGLADNLDVFTGLLAAYGEPQRRYHTAAHISHCLTELDRVTDNLQYPHEVELALWFHDAVYRPLASDNEQRSAEWAADFLADNQVVAESVNRVYQQIMATLHNAQPADSDTRLMVDIDLSILGADSVQYAEFERNVRQEYRWVPGPIYRRKRIEILGSFLDRESVYFSPHFRHHIELRARRNLAATIKRLR